jgi:hypothetical protein
VILGVVMLCIELRIVVMRCHVRGLRVRLLSGDGINGSCGGDCEM